MRRMCAYYYVGVMKMKRSITIGFDARHAMEDGVEFGAYSRLVIEAMALAAPRYTYIRAYAPERTPHSGYNAIERLHNVETMEPDGSLWRKLQIPWQLWRSSRDISNGNVELYHGLAEHIPLGLASRNIRSVVTIHNMAYLYDRSILNSPENLLSRVYMSRMLHRVDRIVAVSECVKRDIVKRFHIDPDKVDVVYSGVAKRFTEPVTEEQMEAVREKYRLPERYILSTGTHLERRNMINIIKILPLLDHELHYVIAGHTTTYTSRLVRAAEELGVSHRVHFINRALDEELPAIYHGAKMLINLSRYEGFPTSVAEAMAAGIPCLVTRKSSMEEIAEDAALYVNAQKREDLVASIRRLEQDEELRNHLIGEGQRHASRFRPEVVVFNLMNTYGRAHIDIRG